MKVLCCGDREWQAWPPIWTALRGLGPLTHVIHGDARGADKMCAHVAAKLGYTVTAYPADWSTLSKAAGPMRNQAMLDTNPDIGLVLAFHDDLARSKGTADMVRRARAAGIPVNVVRADG